MNAPGLLDRIDGSLTRAEGVACILEDALNHLTLITQAYAFWRESDFAPDGDRLRHFQACVLNAENEVYDLVRLARRTGLLYLSDGGLLCADQGEDPQTIAQLGGSFTFAREMPEDVPAPAGVPA